MCTRRPRERGTSDSAVPAGVCELRNLISAHSSSLSFVVLMSLACSAPKRDADAPVSVVVAPAPPRGPEIATSSGPTGATQAPPACTVGDRWRQGVLVCDGDPIHTCRAPVEAAAQCGRLAPGPCRLEPPPAYWSTPARGMRPTDEAMAAEQARLRLRPVPECMCSCTAEFREQYDRWQRSGTKLSAR